MSIGTAFFPRERDLNRAMAWGEWSGFHSAAVYAEHHDIEYAAIRDAAAVIDVSPLYKYVVRGRDAARLLDRVMTRNISAMAKNRVVYTPWCDEAGKVLDDGTVTRLGPDEFRITAADSCYRWFVLNRTGLDVEILDITDQTSGLAVQGKLSREVLEAATGASWADLSYFGRRATRIDDVDVDVTRTGYTGDRGYELWIPTEAALEVWDRLFEVGAAYRLRACGIRAMDVARVEAGLILIEAEYVSARHAVAPEQTYSPYELGMDRLVDLGKEVAFNGREALRAEHDAGGPRRRLVGLELDWAGIEAGYARHGLAPNIPTAVQRDPVPVYKDKRRVGRATSIAWGSTLKKMVGFGSIERSLAAPGTRVSVEWSVEGERGAVGATVVPMPFLDLSRKRS